MSYPIEQAIDGTLTVTIPCPSLISNGIGRHDGDEYLMCEAPVAVVVRRGEARLPKACTERHDWTRVDAAILRADAIRAIDEVDPGDDDLRAAGML